MSHRVRAPNLGGVELPPGDGEPLRHGVEDALLDRPELRHQARQGPDHVAHVRLGGVVERSGKRQGRLDELADEDAGLRHREVDARVAPEAGQVPQGVGHVDWVHVLGLRVEETETPAGRG